jgi:hypothetical protein
MMSHPIIVAAILNQQPAKVVIFIMVIAIVFKHALAESLSQSGESLSQSGGGSAMSDCLCLIGRTLKELYFVGTNLLYLYLSDKNQDSIHKTAALL